MVYIVPLVRGTSTSNDGATVDSFQAVSGSTRAGNGIDDDGNGRRGEVGWGMENPGCDSSLIVDVRAERRRHWAPFKTGRG